MTALICGSVAFDTIMKFPDRFRDHILSDRVDVISVCFTAPEMRREFGGCAGNVAYSLKLLGGDPIPMATVGHDFGPYASWMDEIGIEREVRDRSGRLHRPGIHHHRHREQPHHDVSSGRDEPCPCQLRGRCERRRHRYRDAGRARRDGAPRVRVRRVGHPLHLRSRTADAPVRAGGARVLPRPDHLAHREYLRVEPAPGAVRPGPGRHRGPGRGGSRDPGGGGLCRARARPGGAGHPSGGGFRGRWTRRDAAMPTGRASCSASSPDSTGRTTGRIASLAGAIKVAHPGCQNHRFDPDEFAARFHAEFGYSF